MAARGWAAALRRLREAAWPTPLPDPPGAPRAPAARGHLAAWRRAAEAYGQTWRRPRSGEPSPAAKAARAGGEGEGEWRKLGEELGAAAESFGRRGVRGLAPLVRQAYATRLAAYRDGLKEFVAGYREGLSTDFEGPAEDPVTRERAGAGGDGGGGAAESGAGGGGKRRRRKGRKKAGAKPEPS